MKIKKIYILLAVFVITSLILFQPSQIVAQRPNEWSTPYRLSSEEGTRSGGAFMVSDQYGYVNVFWVENGLPGDHSIIQYSRFDGETWSAPLDVYASRPGAGAGGREIGFLSPVVGNDDNLHLLWIEGNSGPVYYSTAPVTNALSAQQWTNPVRIDVPAFRARLQIDSLGHLHLLYTDFYGTEPGIYYIRSEDSGNAWTDPYKLDPDIPDSHAAPELQFALDSNDGLHALWTYMDLSGSSSVALRYAHSLDGGIEWDLPIDIDTADESPSEVRAARPNMIVKGTTVHVIWAGTEDTNREHRFSTDAGRTWSVPNRIFGSLHGEAIGDGLAIDSSGRIHFFGQIRYPQAVYHAYWDQNHWSVPTIAYFLGSGETRGDHYHAHYVRAAVRAGNQLVITFTDESLEGPLYAMHRTLDDIPSGPVKPIPSPTATPNAVEPTTTPTAIPSQPTPTPRSFDTNEPAEDTDGLSSTFMLGLSIAPVFLLVSSVVLFQFFHRRQ